MAKSRVKYLLLASVLLVLVATGNLGSAPLTDVPVTIKQPDGRIINCFACGDEFYNWLHDKDGYVITQDPITGYYTYAIKANKSVIPSAYVVGDVDPESIGLGKSVQVSPSNMIDTLSLFSGGSPATPGKIMNAPKTGTINNLAVFIRFSDDDEFSDSINVYHNMFNSSAPESNSVRNYFEEVSYNQLSIVTTFYPAPSQGTVVSYKDSLPRTFYQSYNSVTNPNGYKNDLERTIREHSLLKNAIDAISSEVPISLNVYGAGTGNVDNICFIVKGGPTGYNSLLWPHQWELNSEKVYINGKMAYTYNVQLETILKSKGVGVLSHEMFHSLGAPDLYHYSHDGLQPVHKWDIMGMVLDPPQHIGAYAKYRYGTWIPEIPIITKSGTYSLNPLTSSSNNAYRINTPSSLTEYFIVEYRKKTGAYEDSLPGEGLLVYRINTNQDGKGDGNGPPDEVYIYRPYDTKRSIGNPDNAALNSDVGNPSSISSTYHPILLSNGTAAGWSLSNVESSDDTITFTVLFDTAGQASGQVTAAGGAGISKVKMTFTRISGTGSVPTSVSTDSSGNWTQSGFEKDTTYQVTASKKNYDFTPGSRNFAAGATGLNFTGTHTGFSASGNVATGGGAGISKVTMTFTRVSGTGSVPSPVTVDAAGNWSQSGFKDGTTYQVTPSRKNYQFTPASRTFDAAGTSLNFIGTPLPFSASGSAVMAGGVPLSEVTITFTVVSGTGSVPAPVLTVSGGWAQSGFEAGTTYRATPSKLNYKFKPAYFDFSAQTQGLVFIGTSTIFSGSGWVACKTNKGGSIPDVTMAFTAVSGTGFVPAPVLTDVSGNWRQTGFEDGTTYEVTPTKSGYTFNPEALEFSKKNRNLNFIGTLSFIAPPTLFYPSNGSVVAVDYNSEITFKWNAVPEAKYYRIQVSKNAAFNPPFVVDVETDKKLELERNGFSSSGKTYYWRVMAGNGETWSAWSEVWTFISGIKFPDPPILLYPGNGDHLYPVGAIDFTWYPVRTKDGNCGYDIQIAKTPSFSKDDMVLDVGVDGPLLRVDGWNNDGKTYWWRVRAGAFNQRGAWSEAWTFVNGSQFATPVPAFPLSGTDVPGTEITFRWTSSTAPNYHLQVSRDKSFTDLFFDGVLGPGLEAAVPGFPNDGKKFWWKVRAGDGTNWGPWSDSSMRWFTNGAYFGPPTLIAPGSDSQNAAAAITFSWNASAGATNYHLQVFRDVAFTNSFSNIFFDGTVGNVTTFALPGFPGDGTTFWWRVKAGKTTAWTDWSDAQRFFNGPQGFSAPTLASPATGSNVALTTVPFQWNASAGAIRYHLQVSRNNAFTNLVFDQEVGNNTGFDLSGFPNNGSTFWWRVRAGNAATWSKWSSVWSLVNGTLLIPPPVLSAPANGSNASGIKVIFSWAVSPGANNYRLQVSRNEAFTDLLFNQPLDNHLDCEVPGFPNDGSTFWWRVRAGKDTTWGDWSLVWSLVNGTPLPPTLSGPANGSNAGGTTLSLSWNASSGATNYHLQVSQNDSFTNLFFNQPVGNNTGYNPSGFPNDGSTFWWRVKAGKDTAWSSWSSAWSFVNGAQVIPPPTLFSPANGSYVSGTDVSLSWSASSGATTYHLQISEDAAFTSLAFDQSVGSNTGASLTEFPDDGCTYWWRVRAGNGAMWSAWSSVWTFINGSQFIQPPVLSYPPYGSNYSGVTVPFRWSAASGANNYYVQISQDQYFTDLIFDQAIGNYPNGVDLTDFPNDGCTFWWRVAAGNGGTWSNWSSVWWFVNGSGHSLEPPVLYSPYYGSIQYGDTVTFSWYSSSGANNYYLQISHNSSFTDLVVDKSFGNNTTVYATDLFDYGCTYYWRVAAGNGSTWSNWSSVWWFK
jgi:M6 family metalloprotease-like protein